MADQELTCRDCGATFTFTEGEQEFYASKELSAPQRCKNCRQNRRSQRMQQREMHDAVCSQCGNKCQVPFKPREDRPVLCRDCFMASRGGDAPMAKAA
jgi:CxxC-x17-CxxC domain-containing protein